MNRNIHFLIVDLFCGAGGTTTGFEMAEIDGQKVALVIACVNHDKNAIESHAANHPHTKHFFEDIRKLSMKVLADHVDHMRRLYPDAKLILHASLECTNFSKAKGGQPRDADSRTLADHMDRYVKALDPDYMTIENVVEFMSWGPLDDNGKPISRKNGSDFMAWCKRIDSYGYRHDWKELNSANFGAYTSRNRLFGIFAKPAMPIVWPEPSHAKKQKSKGDLFAYTEKKAWKPVREVLDLNDKGESIFTRKKALSPKTLERIYAGLIKFVAGGKDSHRAFISQYNSGKPNSRNTSIEDPVRSVLTENTFALISSEFITQRNSGDPESKIVDVNGPARTITGTGGNQDLIQPEFLTMTYAGSSNHHGCTPLDQPARTITTRPEGLRLVQPQFISKYFSGKPDGKNISVEGTAGTVKTIDGQAVVSAEFLQSYNGNGAAHSIDDPCATVPTHDRFAKVSPQFIMANYTTGDNNKDLDSVCGTIVTNPKENLVSAEFITTTNFNGVQQGLDEPCRTITADRHHHYLMNPQFASQGATIDAPCFTLIAKMDKRPPYLIETLSGHIAIEIYETDCEMTILIKEFMAAYGIVDILMRMLRILELLRIQGFPANYKLQGTQADQKKQLGNAVVPVVPQRMAEALSNAIHQHKKQHNHDNNRQT